MIQLRSIVNDVKIFTQLDECINFLTEVNDQKAFLILEGTLGQQIVPLIHDIPQLDAVYIFCHNKSRRGATRIYVFLGFIFQQDLSGFTN